MNGAFNLRARLTFLAFAGLLAGLGGVVIIALSHREVSQPAVEITFTALTGWAWLGVGILAWWRRPDNPFGKWMVFTAFAWMLRPLLFSNSSLVFTFAIVASYLFPFALVETLVRFPSGRIEASWDRWIVRLVIVVLVLITLGVFFESPEFLGLKNAPENLLTVRESETTTTVLLLFVNAAAIVLTLALIRSFTRKYASASPPMRRLIGPVLWTSTLLLAGLGLESTFSIAGMYRVEDIAQWATSLVAMLLPFSFLLGLFRGRLVRGQALGRMFERVAHETDPLKMQEAVAEALGDPSVELGFWLPETDQYVDVSGLPIPDSTEDSSRAVSEVRMDQRKVALIIHDGALLEEPEKIEAVSRGAALAFENVRLAAEVRATVAELRASRTRIVEAGDAARREIERNLHDGAQQNLVALALKLKMARLRVEADPQQAIEILDGASAELEQTLAELRELARGIHPAVLSDRGLDAALLALAHRSPFPVEVGRLPENRLPEPVEAAAYYVVAESLTNVARYAKASRAKVDIRQENGTVLIRIVDDGVGGADPTNGSGLKGLADRIAALDGQLKLASPEGKGTIVEAEIPCA